MKEIPLFFIVGAQKAGTTSLHRYLSAHPDIHMPIEKEVPFFDKEGIDSYSWKLYQHGCLMPQYGEKTAGTSTPQYMCDHRIPERIARYAPNAKIIIILRDPIERAVSHYKMLVNRGKEERTFKVAIEEQLCPESLQLERNKTYEEIISSGEHNSYICRGEYKRLVDCYNEYFSDSVKVICSSLLKKRRKETVIEILRFLEVSESINSNAISREHHSSSISIMNKTKKMITQSRTISTVAQIVLSSSARAHIRQKYFSYIASGSKPLEVDGETYNRLMNHFQETNDGLDTCKNLWYLAQPSMNGIYRL